MSDKIEININSSSLRYSHCLLSWQRTIVEGYTEPRFSAKIVYGLAVHKYIDTMFKTGDMALAKDAALAEFRKPKNLDDKAPWMADEGHLIWTCFDVWNNYCVTDSEFEVLQKPDGTPATEVTFSHLFFEDDTIIVNICGTIDSIGKIKGGCYSIRDWKSTSARDEKSYLANYRMSHQLRFYVMSLKVMAQLYPDSQLGQIGAQRIGAFIDGIFVKQKAVENKFKRSEIFMFSNDDLAMFQATLIRRLTELSLAIRTNTLHYKEGIVKNTCELKYNKCPFWAVCSSGNPQIEALMLKQHFIKQTYDPLNRDK